MKRIFKIKDNLAIKTFRYDDMPGLILRNRGQSLVSVILRLLIPIGGRLSPSWVRVTVLMLKEFNRIAKQQGLPGLIKTLKVASVLLQQSLSGHVLHDITPLGMRISRSRGGIPRIIPVLHRRLIAKGSPVVIRYYLTIFSIYRDIIIPGKIKLSTITSPFQGDPAIFARLSKFIPRFSALMAVKPLVPHSYESFESKGGDSLKGWNPKEAFPYTLNAKGNRYIPSKTHIAKLLKGIPRITHQLNPFSPKTGFNKGWAPFPIAKSSPLTLAGQVSTHPRALLRALAVISNNNALGTDLMTVISRVDQSRGFARFWYNRFWKLLSNSVFPLVRVNLLIPLGKLGLKYEAAGKVRVFAMVDAFTQWALRPLHKYLFSLLRQHKMDGTFDQLAPLSSAWGHKTLYSLDLSAATDRLPIVLQEMLLADLLADKKFAKAWRNLLVNRDYKVPAAAVREGASPTVRYAVGQPMGALSSWAMLAYTHHFIVQCAAWETNSTSIRTLFRDYAVLGDDIVIFNRRVAEQYLKIIKSLGVECGLAKSVISPNGAGLEFAKKTFLRSVNVSPAPLKELNAALSSLVGLREYARLYKLSLNQAIKLSGAGYKVMGGLDKPLNKQSNFVRLLKIVFFVPMSVTEMSDFYLQLGSRIKSLQLNKVLDDFIRSYYTRFYSRVRMLLDRLENMSDLQYMASPKAMEPMTGVDKFKWLEIERDLYLMAYHPYYENSKRILKDLMKEIEGIRSSYAIGIWRLYGKTLKMEHDLASISANMFSADKIDVTPSPEAKDVRFWRAFSKELAKIKTSQLTSNNKTVKMTEAHLLWWIPLVFRIPKGLIWKSLPTIFKHGRKVIRRLPAPIIVKSSGWFIRVLIRLIQPVLLTILGLILIIGLVSIRSTDWMWDTGVSHHTSSSLYGLISYYYGYIPNGGEHIPSRQPYTSGGTYLLYIILGIFLSFWLGTGVLYYNNWSAIQFVVSIQNLRVIDLIEEGAETLSPFQIHLLLCRFWLGVFEQLTWGLWDEFLLWGVSSIHLSMLMALDTFNGWLLGSLPFMADLANLPEQALVNILQVLSDFYF